jgi:hypothetical protein
MASWVFPVFSKAFAQDLGRFSGSQPAEDGRMMSRAPEMRLDNAESRRDCLDKIKVQEKQVRHFLTKSPSTP